MVRTLGEVLHSSRHPSYPRSCRRLQSVTRLWIFCERLPTNVSSAGSTDRSSVPCGVVLIHPSDPCIQQYLGK